VLHCCKVSNRKTKQLSQNSCKSAGEKFTGSHQFKTQDWTEDRDILMAHLVTAYSSRVCVSMWWRTSAVCLSCGAIHQSLNSYRYFKRLKSDDEYALHEYEEERQKLCL